MQNLTNFLKETEVANLSKWQGAKVVKMLYLGNSGAGKTGSVASLADAGYNVRILDLENKLGVLTNVLLSPKSIYKKDSITRVSSITVAEKRKILPGSTIIEQAQAYTKATTLMNRWKDEEEDFGPITTWTEQDVLVIDSLSAFAKAAFRHVLALNGRLGKQPFQADYGIAQEMVENFLENLADPSIACHVIVICHIAHFTPAGEISVKGFPQSIGQALNTKLARYFDTVLLAQNSGSGVSSKRKILTNNTSYVDLKTTVPLSIPAELPIETGLAEYFKLVLATQKQQQVALPAAALQLTGAVVNG